MDIIEELVFFKNTNKDNSLTAISISSTLPNISRPLAILWNLLPTRTLLPLFLLIILTTLS